VFDALTSFADLEDRVNRVAEEKDRGDIFEIFIEGYLATQTIAQSRQHWVVGSIPLEMRERYNLPNDGTGIDGIYEATDGTHVAYQVKYRQKSNLTYQEVAPFLGLIERFADQVVFTNASTLAHQAVSRTRWVSRQDFMALSGDALAEIRGWLVGTPTPHVRAVPDPSYQVQALSDIAATFETNSRATVVMACGTGKTLLALWAAEQAKPKSVLVLLPSLSLVQQTVREWTRHTSLGSRFAYICVCSDDSVSKDDELELDVTDLGFRVDTDPATVRAFLEHPADVVKVVFSTYQSSEVVSEGSKGLAPFDIAIFDEAHKTTGLAGGQFGRALSDDHIRIQKRLFLTATPRHFDIRSKRDEDGEFKVQSMDDVAVYGPRAHTLSFHAAAEKGIICKYKVIISITDKEIVDDFVRKHGITLVEGDEIGARWVSNLVALKQAIEQTGATKAITFHSRVALAQEFASDTPRGLGHYIDDFQIRHVNGKQNSADRAELIRAFADAPKSVITNARCLTEGVDIPAVDMVAFIDPRQSRVDIAQAVGRAMRKPRGPTTKTVGYVFVPLFCGMDGESIEEAIKTEKFEAVADVLNALQEHDEELVDIIREIKQRKGEGLPFNPKALSDKVQLIGPRIDFERLSESVGIAIANRIGVSWDEWYGMLRAYVDATGDCNVPFAASGLGRWVAVQRQAQHSLTRERTMRLEEIGFDWDPHETAWHRAYRLLRDFKECNGHCRVPARHVVEGLRLGQWMTVQRSNGDQMREDRKKLLDAVGFEWDVHAAMFKAGFQALTSFSRREGHASPPVRHVEDGYQLGKWVNRIRTHRAELSPDAIDNLDGLKFIFDPYEVQWQNGLAQFKKYAGTFSERRVPQAFVTPEGFALGNWVGTQRRSRATLSPVRLLALEEANFNWSGQTDAWADWFSLLVEYKAQFGDCLVPAKFEVNGSRLGGWVRELRLRADSIPEPRKVQLDALGFVWDVAEHEFQVGLAHLREYKAHHGDCLVPNLYQTDNGFKLGTWVANRRTRCEILSASHRAQLNLLGFAWDAKRGPRSK
jgi:superfamily II DNA or RNA helicase